MALIVRTTTALLLGCVLVCGTHATATAQDGDAEAIFKRCAERVNQIGNRVTNAQRKTVHDCVPRIRRLLEEGSVERARRLARWCNTQLDSLTEAGIHALRLTCQPCVRKLRELEAYELARRLLNHCEEHAQQLRQQNRRGKNIIKGLFDSD